MGCTTLQNASLRRSRPFNPQTDLVNEWLRKRCCWTIVQNCLVFQLIQRWNSRKSSNTRTGRPIASFIDKNLLVIENFNWNSIRQLSDNQPNSRQESKSLEKISRNLTKTWKCESKIVAHLSILKLWNDRHTPIDLPNDSLPSFEWTLPWLTPKRHQQAEEFTLNKTRIYYNNPELITKIHMHLAPRLTGLLPGTLDLLQTEFETS